MEAMEV
jgi:hypothetical protein